MIILCLLPRYIAKSAKILYWPSDIDILRSARKQNPRLDIWNHPLLGGRPEATEKDSNSTHEPNSFPPRPPIYSVSRSMGSRTDMATGLQSVHRGFDFATEEDGVSMRRMQSNLSERHAARRNGSDLNPRKRTGSISLFPSLRRSMRKRSKLLGSPPTDSGARAWDGS